MVGYSLKELQLRRRDAINILTIKRMHNDEKSQNASPKYMSKGVPSGETTLEQNDKLIVFGDKDNCEKMMELN
jgi:Trk K+ transport system NAD-binding subunit